MSQNFGKKIGEMEIRLGEIDKKIDKLDGKVDEIEEQQTVRAMNQVCSREDLPITWIKVISKDYNIVKICAF